MKYVDIGSMRDSIQCAALRTYTLRVIPYNLTVDCYSAFRIPNSTSKKHSFECFFFLFLTQFNSYKVALQDRIIRL